METKDKALKDMTDLADHILMLQNELIRFVGEARADGATWEEIGTGLQISKQAAQQKYAKWVKTEQLGCGHCDWTVAYPKWDQAGAMEDWDDHTQSHYQD